MAAGTGTARSRCRGQKRAGARHRRRSAGRRLLRAAGGRRGAASRAERFQGAAAAEGASGAGRAAQPLQSGPGSVPEQRPRGRPGPGRRRDAGIPARARAAAEAAPAGGGRPRASGAGPARSGAGAAAAVRGLGVRRAMGEAGTGPGPREGPEPEEDEAAAAAAAGGGGGARGGRAGPRGGIRVLKRNVKRNGSRSCLNRTRFGSRERDWLREDAGRGCVYVYGRDSTSCASSDLRLVLCTVDTPASEICDGEERKNLFLQLHGDLVRDVFATEEIPELLTAGGDVLRVIELFRLETTSKITESNDPPNTAAPQLNHVPVHLIHTSLKHLQGWRLHHHPGQPVAMPNHPFREEILFPEMGVTGIALVTISVSNRKQSQTAPACISTGR